MDEVRQRQLVDAMCVIVKRRVDRQQRQVSVAERALDHACEELVQARHHEVRTIEDTTRRRQQAFDEIAGRPGSVGHLNRYQKQVGLLQAERVAAGQAVEQSVATRQTATDQLERARLGLRQALVRQEKWRAMGDLIVHP